MKRINIILIIFIIFFLGLSAACAEQLGLFIHYDVEIDAKTFMQEEPVIIMVIASNPDAMNEYYDNNAQGKKEKKIKPIIIGKSNSPWTDAVTFKVRSSKGQEVGVAFRAASPTEKEAKLDAESSAKGYFFIAPEEVKKLGPGEYTVQAFIENAASEPLKLNIAATRQLTGKANIPHLLKLGRYNLLSDKFAEAQKYAEQILAIEPTNLQGMNLLGDAQTGLGKYSEAYATFQKAIDEYFRQYPPDGTGTYEPPELLNDKANDLKKKIR